MTTSLFETILKADYLPESFVKGLFYTEEQYNKAFRGCTLMEINGEWYLPIQDLKDRLSYGYLKD